MNSNVATFNKTTWQESDIWLVPTFQHVPPIKTHPNSLPPLATTTITTLIASCSCSCSCSSLSFYLNGNFDLYALFPSFVFSEVDRLWIFYSSFSRFCLFFFFLSLFLLKKFSHYFSFSITSNVTVVLEIWVGRFR